MQHNLPKLLMLLCVCLGFGSTSQVLGQINLSTLGTPYSQDFNTLASSGTSSDMPAGWTFVESGTSSANNGLYTAGTGSGNAGDTYSLGTTAADRALGSLLSGTFRSTIGASFTNSTGSTVTSLEITYTGEMWRVGTLNREDRLEFQYSTSATELLNGSYTGVSQLDFKSLSAATTGAKDGNAEENRTTLTHTITGLNIAPGATFWIRWNDIDAAGADDALAVDDFFLTPLGGGTTPVDTTPPVLAASPFVPADGATGVTTTTLLTIEFNEAVKAGAGNIILRNTTDGADQALAVQNTAAVRFEGNTVTLAGATLEAGKAYAVQIASGAVTDMAGNAFAGFTDNTTWNFNTAAASVPDAGTTLTQLDVAYLQNFDGMGSGNNYPANWEAVRASGSGETGAALTLGVTNGATSSGNIYNVGTTGAADRAMGTLASGSTVPRFGAQFTNSTGKIVTAVDLKGVMEQWRTGSSNAVDEVVAFEYSLNATSLSDGSWTRLPDFDLKEIQTTSTTAAAKDGNSAENRTALQAVISNIAWRSGSTLWIRWTDNDDPGSDGLYAINDFELTPRAPEDLTPPALAASNPLTPAAGNMQVDFATPLSITFSELVEAGTGVISIRNVTDNTVQTINMADVLVQDRTATIPATLAPGTAYEVLVPQGAFIDLAGNLFAGIAAGEWTFTTAIPNPFAQNFNQCISNLPGGWQQYSVTGNEVWECTTFGLNGTQGIQINGFNGGAKLNEDWLISPAFDLATGFDYPVLSFWSRTRFGGESLKLMVSTDYSGSGNPAAATWKEINGTFPELNSDVWAQSTNINLTNFKAEAVYIAFVYTSTTSAASRWTLDDVVITNSETAPVTPVFFSSTATPLSNFDFGYVSGTEPTAAKSLTFYALDLASDLTVTAPVGFEISKDNSTFTTSLTYTAADAFDENTLYVRFSSNSASPGAFSGSIRFTAEGFDIQRGYLTASTLAQDKTLDVMTWNIEWFGNTGLGPTDEAQQLANVKKVILEQAVEVVCVQEIANVPAFENLVSQLPGYRGFLSDNVSGSGGANAQRVGFIYKTSQIDSVTTRPMLVNPASPANFWASGRLPYLFVADATIEGVTKRLHFIAIHAKANENTSPENALSAYNRRLSDVQVLKDSLDLYYPEANIIMLGDFNDDVDYTVANVSTTASTYAPFVDDAANYKAVTKTLSDAGLRTYITFDNVIDHVVISNELYKDYLPGSSKIFIPFDLIPDYGSTTSDHMPVTARFVLKPNVTFASTGATVPEDAGTYNVTLTLDRASATEQQITVAVTLGDGVTEDDFVDLQTEYVLTVPAGAVSATLPITIVDDEIVEEDESVFFTVTNTTGGYGFSSFSNFTLTVQDNDLYAVNFAATSATISENAGSYKVNITLNQPSTQDQTVVIGITNGTGAFYGEKAGGYVTNPVANANTLTLTIPAGQTSASFIVRLFSNTKKETDKLISFAIIQTSTGAAAGSADSFALTVLDETSPGIGGPGNAKEMVVSPNASNGPVTLTFSDDAVYAATDLVLTLWDGQRGSNVLTVTGDLATIVNALNQKLATSRKGTYILKVVNETTFYQTRLMRN